MTKRSFLVLTASYLLLILGLFFYSFTQIDLNLTLSQASSVQNFQKFFIQIGYFNRPLSTVFFLVLIFFFFLFYFLFLWLVKRGQVKERQIYFLIGLTAAILIFSYPAFSHDLFNYMFWARTFTHYGVSPYDFRPLDFPDDPWVRFMHWTHSTYNHGPIFLLLSLLPSFLGFGKFLLTLFNFKLLMAMSYLGSLWLIGKISEKIDSNAKLSAVVFFALNPLIIIESLVNGHDDILMLFFALLSFYLLTIRKNLLAVSLLLFSSGIKFLTVSLLPLYFLAIMAKKINWQLLLKIMIVLLLVSLIPVIRERESYPWYFVTPIGLASLVMSNRFISLVVLGLSLGLLMRYAPFLYLGDYQPPVPTLVFWLTVMPIIFSIVMWMFLRLSYFKALKKKDER